VGPPLYKAAAVVSVRQQIRERDLASALYLRLSPAERAVFDDVTATEWMSVADAERIYVAAAPLLHAGRTQQVRLVGRDIARAHLNGLYRCILRAMTVPLLLEQTARLWGTYNRKGKLAAAVSDVPRCAQVTLEGYPDYPAALRDVLAGYILGSIELTGARDGRVVHDDMDPARWRYTVTWR